MRLELLQPGTQFLDGALYNRVLTLHGFTMIFLFIIPSIPAVFGNFFLPMMVGANDVAFPRLNLASWYLYVVGGVFALISVSLGGPDTGWTLYVPYSATTDANVLYPILSAFILGWSSMLTAVNFITTVHRLRTPTMKWGQMPLFVWGSYATSWIAVVATPVVAITLIMVLVERFLGVGIFDARLGGDPILFQHLFWIYSHPAVYVMVLPAMGVASEIVPVFSQKKIFGYKFIAMSSMLIAAIGSLVWAHHMFTSGMADEGRIIFSFLTFLVSIPSAIKVFNWLATMYKGSIRVDRAVPLDLRVHLPVHHRGVHGPDAGRPLDRHPPARHVVHRGALPLHDVRRHPVRCSSRHCTTGSRRCSGACTSRRPRTGASASGSSASC